MKLPKEITIGESVWQVRRPRKLKAPGKGEVLGLCDTVNQVIHVKAGLGYTETLVTFVHEVLHAFEDEYELDIPHELVYGLEAPIAYLLLDNFLGR